MKPQRFFKMFIVGLLLISLFLGASHTLYADEIDPEEMSVAILLPGPRDDGGWSQAAYEGIKYLEEEYGIEGAYSESVDTPDAPEYIRGYAEQGYDWIIGHSFTFGDPIMDIAPEYQDIKFTVNSSNVTQDPNVSSFDYTPYETGFVAGIVAGLLTETNQVAMIGGLEIPPIINNLEGFEKGVEYVNPEAEAITLLTGISEDISQAQETATSLIEDGVDVLTADADQATYGVIYAAEEHDIYHVGMNRDQNEVAPDTVVTSALQNYYVAMEYIFKDIIEGDYGPQYYELGYPERAIDLASFHDFAEELPDEFFEELDTVLKELEGGEIDLEELPPHDN